jgi:hypothetical protein
MLKTKLCDRRAGKAHLSLLQSYCSSTACKDAPENTWGSEQKRNMTAHLGVVDSKTISHSFSKAEADVDAAK